MIVLAQSTHGCCCSNIINCERYQSTLFSGCHNAKYPFSVFKKQSTLSAILGTKRVLCIMFECKKQIAKYPFFMCEVCDRRLIHCAIDGLDPPDGP
jgi:hypothetical protein